MSKKKPRITNGESPKEWRELPLGRKIYIILIVLAVVLILLKSTQIPIVRDSPVGTYM